MTPAAHSLDRTPDRKTDFLHMQTEAEDSAKTAECSGCFRTPILAAIGTAESALYSVLNRTGAGDKASHRVIPRRFGTF